MFDAQDTIRFIDEWVKNNIESPKGKSNEQIREIGYQMQAIEEIKECVYQGIPNNDITDILFEYMLNCLRITKVTQNTAVLYIYDVKYGTAEKMMDSI